jgi:hypothetical protein
MLIVRITLDNGDDDEVEVTETAHMNLPYPHWAGYKE